MPKNDPSREAKVTCPICGFESPAGSERCDNCYHTLGPVSEGDDGAGDKPVEGGGELQELLCVPGIGHAKAEVLHEAGYKCIKDLQEAKVEDLASIKGIGERLASKIITRARAISAPQDKGLADWLSGEDNGLSSWLSGDERQEQPAATVANSHMTPTDSLARWLSGKEDNIDSWLEESKAVPRTDEKIHPQELLEKEAELIQLRETISEKLRQFESGEFDPQATIEELARIKTEMEAERSRRVRLEEELENVKRGSIAVIKFIKGQKGTSAEGENLEDRLASEMALRENLELKIMELEGLVSVLKEKTEKGLSELPADQQELRRQEMAVAEKALQLEAMEKQLVAKEDALKEGLINYGRQDQGKMEISDQLLKVTEESASREKEYVDRIHDLEVKLSQAELGIKQKEEMLKLSGGAGKALDPAIKSRLEDAQRLERTVSLRQQEVDKLREELRIRDEEMTKLKEPLRYKEEEMLRREEDLMFREKLLMEEQKKVARTQAELTSTDELTLKKRLEELQADVTAKEEEIRSKEKYLGMKEEELRTREQGLIGDEIEKREADRMIEIKQEKVKTGTSRLDDLLLGGMPFGSNVLIYGPPFAGKEVLVNSFVAEGLKKGIPVLWVITEKASKEIREEMMFVLSGYEEYEKRGLVRYVDSYSRSMGDESQDPYTVYVESPTDYESVQKAVEEITKEFKASHEYYRFAFRSISTMIAYLDPNTAFRFLSPIVGRRKRDRSVGMYTIEKGVHGDQEIQMLGSLMDGMIEFKLENLNTFLSIKGICDVQSRAYIRYSSTKAGVTIGSFSLDHIR